MLFRKRKEENIIKKIYEHDKLERFALLLLGVLLVALAYNLLILPIKIVYGMSGVGVILNGVYGLNPSIVILIGDILLLFLSWKTLGFEKTKNSIIGSILLPIFIALTANIGEYIVIDTSDTLLITICGAVINGFGLGLVFKSGFTTGGTDILNQIVSKYCKISIGNAMFLTDGVIIFIGMFAFGWTQLMYSLISLYIISIMTDKVILGISNSKAFYIITTNETDVKKYIMSTLGHGVTVLDGRGGFTGNHKKVIMCVIPTSEYFALKEGIHEIDKDAFFLVSDAYEVFGGE
ncbi:MAG: YitT family protein [Bacilli bacterium]|nr:YitT family protein [Bacilli bacterium]